MPEPPSPKPLINSLTTRIILFAFLSTLATALTVSWTSIYSTYVGLSTHLEQRSAADLERAAERLEAWIDRRGGIGPLADAEPGEISALLERERPHGGVQLLLLDEQGRVLAGAVPEGETPVPRVALEPLDPDGPAGLRQYADADGRPLVGSARRLAGGRWSVALQEPFESAFAPLLAVVTRVFIFDLVILVLFSYLAYRITTALVRPIETISDAARRIAQGQFDHEIPEPDSNDEVGLLARTINDMMRRLRGYQSEIETANRNLTERNTELQQAKETFQQLSITDGLTKLHNHRFFQDHLTREIKRAGRSGEPLSMLLVDIDDFKALNDRFGHAAGDELLRSLAQIMNDTVRESDLLARYGGEEFVVLASNTDLEGAYNLAEKVRTAVAENSFILDDSLRPTRVTVSIGVAGFHGNRKTFFHGADRALYRAKAEGKNCVIKADEA